MCFFCLYMLKVGKFAASIEHPEARNVSASGGLHPLTSDQGLCRLHIPRLVLFH